MSVQTAFFNQLTAKGVPTALATPIAAALTNQCNGLEISDRDRALIHTAHRIIYNY